MKNIMGCIVTAISALAFTITCALAQPSPPPDPWINSGSTISYGIGTVVVGSPSGTAITSPGNINVSGAYYVNGVSTALIPCTYCAVTNASNTFTASPQTVQGLTTTSPGWYAQITGDTYARVRVGLNATDVASIAFGPGNTARDAFIERVGSGFLRYGAPDAAMAVAQTIGVQNIVAGTSNTAGANLTINGSIGTGTGVGGDIIFQVAPAGSSGTAQNAFVTALTMSHLGYATVPTAPFGTSTTQAASTQFVTSGIASNSLAFDLRNYATGGETFSTVCSGTPDDTATAQAAVNAAAALAGQTIGTPALNCKSTATGLTFLNAVNVRMIGQGAGVGADSASVSAFNTTATSGNLIKTPGANGLDLGNMRLSYTSASYAGDLIDLSQGAGSANTNFVTLHDCYIGGSGSSAVNATSLIKTNLTLMTTVRRCFLENAVYGIKMSAASNIFHFEDGWFNEGFSGAQILLQGQAVLIDATNFEPAIAGSFTAGALAATGTTSGLGLVADAFSDAQTGYYWDFTGGQINGFATIASSIGGGTYLGTLGTLSGGLIAGNELNPGGVGACAFYGASARSIVAFANNFDTQNGPNVGSLWCDSGPTIGANFYQGASTLSGLTDGFTLTQHLDIWNYGIAANTNVNGLLLKNPVAATSGNQSVSPCIDMQGQGWKTTSTAASQSTDWLMCNQPAQGTTAPTTSLQMYAQINGSGYTNLFSFNSAGQFFASQVIGSVSGSQFAGTTTLGTAGSSVGSLAFANATSGTETITPATGALGSGVATLKAGTYNIAGDSLTQTWSAVQTFNTSDLAINGGSATAGLASVTSGGVISSCAACTLATSLTTPTIYGGTAAGSALTLQSTSNGSPSGDFVSLKASSATQFLVQANDFYHYGNANNGAQLIMQPSSGGGSSGGNTIYMYNYGGSLGNSLYTYNALGTVASPTAETAGNYLWFFAMCGHDGTNNCGTSGYDAGMFVQTNGNFTTTAHSTSMTFFTTPAATKAAALAFTIEPSGGVAVGTSPDPGVGNAAAARFYSGSSKGVTCSGALTVISSITITGGIITAATGTGGTCS